MSKLEEVSAARFFYENRDLAGFTSPSRSLFTAVRELVENALDATEEAGILPDLKIQLSQITKEEGEVHTFELTVEDNGCGVPQSQVPIAFGKVLASSKYKLRQTRGIFGLGGKMALLYGQITTHEPAKIWTSTGTKRRYYFEILIDIEKNEPIVVKKKVFSNPDRHHGTKVSFRLRGNFTRVASRLAEYFKRTAMVAPYANISYTDPNGEKWVFKRAVSVMPPPPSETLPHPYGVDLELLQRLVSATRTNNMIDFLTTHFHRIGRKTARKFLKTAHVKTSKNPKKLSREELIRIMRHMQTFKFLPPKGTCLSPVGEKLLEAGISKELNPEFIVAHQRKPSAYGGHPFIVEMALAYGGKIPSTEKAKVYRFANRIPLMYDPSGDVIVKVVQSFNWSQYGVRFPAPLIVFVNICSTKIPYKTVGKEAIAPRPEIETELKNGLYQVARALRTFLARQSRRRREAERLETYRKYFSKIGAFTAEVLRRKPPDLTKLLKTLERRPITQGKTFQRCLDENE